MKSFITVKMEVLESLERIVQSGINGTHLLFSNWMIREAFASDVPDELFTDKQIEGQVQEILAKLAEFDTIEERQDFIETLDIDMRNILVHLYFGFLDKLVGQNYTPEVLH